MVKAAAEMLTDWGEPDYGFYLETHSIDHHPLVA